MDSSDHEIQEEAIEIQDVDGTRIVPAGGRVEGQQPQPQPPQQQPQQQQQRTVSAPATTLGPSLAAAAAVRQHTHSHPHNHSTTTTTTTASTTTKPHTMSRSMSRSDQVKEYVKKSTREFFGLDESSERTQRQRWEEKRKRLASRKYGQLKEQQQLHSTHPHQQSFTDDFHALSDIPDPLSVASDSVDGTSWPRPPRRSKDSVAKMTWDGVSYVVATVAKRRAKSQISGTAGGRSKSRSYAPSSMSAADDVFDEPDVSPTTTATTTTTTTTTRALPSTADYQASESLSDEVFFDCRGTSSPVTEKGVTTYDTSKEIGGHYHSGVQEWQRQSTSHIDDSVDAAGRADTRVGRSRIWTRILDRCFDNSDRRQYGMGLVGRMFRRSLKQSVLRKKEVKAQLDEIEDYRPYFTWWVTTVQVFITILTIMCYGFAPVGFSLRQQSGQVLMPSLSIQTVDYWEPSNFWIGPRAADLIHLGAKFAPCMRKDEKIFRHIEEQRRTERETGCCIRNDDSGCVQSSKRECSTTLSVWKKWSELAKGPDGRLSGSVCGQDPNYCKEPASVPPHEWPDDITQWPICRKRIAAVKKINAAEHMACEVIGHPCCIGIHGECRIHTREFCNFVRGYFHEEATLCAQVSCLNNVCGMIPFHNPDVPDQFYRLWTSLFIHAGIVQLFITVVLQYYLMRDLEKLAGPLRIGIIYIVSGIAGNLASAIFVPYRAEVGPSGSQFGLLACLFVEVINSWQIVHSPWRALGRLLGITVMLFIVGLLPWVDNYAHIFGFIFGFLLSYALLPFVSFGPYDRRRKVLLIWVCLVAVVVMLTALIILFYVTPIYECKICEYLNCIPLTRDFCAEQNINLDKKLELI